MRLRIWRHYLRLSIAVLGGLVTFFLCPESWTYAQTITAAIGVATIIAWFSEAIDLHATGLLMAAAFIILWWASPKEVFPQFMDPIVILLLGGLVLAQLLHAYHVDQWLIHRILRKPSYRPKWLLLILMLLTAFLSMWISNTASAALMIPLVLALIHKQQAHLAPVAAVLGIAYAATLGGLGTIIGTAPNALAVSTLEQMGMQIGFLDWMLWSVPLMVMLIMLAWGILIWMYPSDNKPIYLDHDTHTSDRCHRGILTIFGLTVLGWLTTKWTGLDNATVALFPIVAGYVGGYLKTKDFNELNWAILILIGSGIVLGVQLQSSGLADLIAQWLIHITQWLPLFLLMGIVAICGVLLTMFASNTASAAILLPLLAPMADSLGIAVLPLILLVTLSVSLDFTAPMGTPPNTLAYSTWLVNIKTMAKTGLILSVLCCMVLAVYLRVISGWM